MNRYEENTMKTIMVAMLAAAAWAAPVFAQAPRPLTDARGMTLYISDLDTATTSNCNSACAATWPPMLAAPDATGTGSWSVLTRTDGNKQWTYNSKPLYTYKNDTKPGDTSGNGQNNNTWHMATP